MNQIFHGNFASHNFFISVHILHARNQIAVIYKSHFILMYLFSVIFRITFRCCIFFCVVWRVFHIMSPSCYALTHVLACARSHTVHQILKTNMTTNSNERREKKNHNLQQPLKFIKQTYTQFKRWVLIYCHILIWRRVFEHQYTMKIFQIDGKNEEESTKLRQQTLATFFLFFNVSITFQSILKLKITFYNRKKTRKKNLKKISVLIAKSI